MLIMCRLISIFAAGMLVLTPAGAQEAPTAQTAPADVAPSAAPAVAVAPSLAMRVGDLAAKLPGSHPDDRAAVRAFYSATPDKLVWTDQGELTARARSAMTEIAKANDWGLSASSFELPAETAGLSDDAVIEAEARLSLAVLKYARHARGGRMVPTQLSDNLDRTLNLLEPHKVLDGIAAASEPDAFLRRFHPQHPQFERLRQLYLALKAGTYQPDPSPAVAEPEPEPPAVTGAPPISTPQAAESTVSPVSPVVQALDQLPATPWLSQLQDPQQALEQIQAAWATNPPPQPAAVAAATTGTTPEDSTAETPWQPEPSAESEPQPEPIPAVTSLEDGESSLALQPLDPSSDPDADDGDQSAASDPEAIIPVVVTVEDDTPATDAPDSEEQVVATQEPAASRFSEEEWEDLSRGLLLVTLSSPQGD